jgi:hypothetical protein
MIQGVRMKRNKSSPRSDRVSGSNRVSGNEEACLEIQRFLKALESYPECFAQDPGVSFEQHQSGFMPAGRNESGRARQHGSDQRKN